MNVRIYSPLARPRARFDHNPRCSESREALPLLRERNIIRRALDGEQPVLSAVAQLRCK